MNSPNNNSNRLARTTSPYLLQHASNPVDWFPWGEEAFTKARTENKPIFLSIGYSACHWCHVMERESFENKDVAAFLNDNFISIKVDREERPDVDDIYMTSVQMMTGSGGWPLTVFLDAELKPFYGGTYFPPEDRYGRPGFLRLLQLIDDVWRNRQSEVVDAAEKLRNALQLNASQNTFSDLPLSLTDIDQAAKYIAASFDPFRGGFGNAPKFPPTGQMELLLRVWRRTGNREYLEMVERTLQRMSAGGIFDQLGGGFARYSTDADWLVPHFEKMLYDNALLAVNLIDCGMATQKPEYFETARRTLDWALEEMRDAHGGFHSSLDADSEGEEGRYYVWTPDQIEAILGGEEGKLFCEIHDVSEQGNFEHGNSILHIVQPLNEAAVRYGIDTGSLNARLVSMRERLLKERRRRIPPAKDDKVLTDWNSLMITAQVRGFRSMGIERYLQAAREAAAFIRDKMWVNGCLMHSYRNGETGATGLLDDHAYYLEAVLQLYQADFDITHLEEAAKIVDQLRIHFHDPVNGGFYAAPANRNDLIIRTKHGNDGATPSGNALIAASLLTLHRLTGRDEYRQLAEQTLQAYAGVLKDNPTSFLRMACAAEAALMPATQIAIIGDPDNELVRNLLTVINRDYFPGIVVACGSKNDSVLPLFTGRFQINGMPAVYFCHDFVCEAPVTDPESLKSLLQSIYPKADS